MERAQAYSDAHADTIGVLVMRLRTVLFHAGLVLVAIALLWIVAAPWPPKLGIDFGGGVRLVYQVAKKTSAAEDQTNGSSQPIDWPSLVNALSDRLNPAGTSEVVVRPHGQRQVEIVVPRTDTGEAEMINRIDRLVGSASVLELHIVANKNDLRHRLAITQAEKQAQNLATRLSKQVKDGDSIVGYWARVSEKQTPYFGHAQVRRVALSLRVRSRVAHLPLSCPSDGKCLVKGLNRSRHEFRPETRGIACTQRARLPSTIPNGNAAKSGDKEIQLR